jgi:hypothetical protein
LIDALLQPDKTIIAAGNAECSNNYDEKQEEEDYTTTDTECFRGIVNRSGNVETSQSRS